MRLLICAGGTGGGVYPALSVLKALGSENDTVLWVGSEGGMEAGLVTRSGVDFTAIPAAGVHGVGLRALPGNLGRLARGTLAARRVIAQFRPDVIFFTGGYVAVPVALAGLRTPSLVFCPDIVPGLALQFLGRTAQVIAITCEESRGHFPSNKQVVVTGYPTRPGLSDWSRATARGHLGLTDKLPVILVAGGSKGAQTINRAIQTILPELLEKAQVIHITGQTDFAVAQETQRALPEHLAERYHPFAFLHEDMGAALAAADFAVSRSGASTLGEYPLFGLPAILIPYPFAWRYQKVNAAYLHQQGAALSMPDEEMAARLADSIFSLLADSTRLEQMRQAMQTLARPDASRDIANLLRQLAARGKEVG